MKAAERVTIHVKATEQYFIVVLFTVQYKVVLKPGQHSISQGGSRFLVCYKNKFWVFLEFMVLYS